MMATALALETACWFLMPARVLAAETAKTPAVRRAPIPSEEALHRAEAAARQLYQEELGEAREESQKRVFAKRLLEAALSIQDNPTDRYALLRMARDMSREAADLATALASIDEMARGYEVNPLEMKAHVVATVARRAISPAQRRFVVDHAIVLIDAAIAADEYAVAQGLLQTAQGLSKKDRELAQRIGGQEERIEAGAAAFAEVRSAMSRLAEEPGDPKANGVVGKYWCFAKGDFSRGLPMLKKSGDPILEELAGRDLANPGTPDQQLCLADAWWQLADSAQAAAKPRIQSRAHFWYSKAVAKLTGLEKARTQQRMEQFELTRYDLDAAIDSGLDWLARQQQKDGSWTFASDPDPGTWDSPVAATGLALLPFLSAGHTHLQGEHKLVVRKGLLYLTNRMQAGPNGGDLRDTDSNGMTAHCLGSLALCEACARSKDKRLQATAQMAVNFLVCAQHPKDGGFSTTPKSTGVTTYLGWPLFTLLAATEARLSVPQQTVQGVDGFLERVQTSGGSSYGLSAARPADATPLSTAIGLLARAQLTGHGRSVVVKEGIGRLAALPVTGDVQFQCFAACLISGGDREVWQRWKPAVQGGLLKLQEKQGATQGSWFRSVSPGSPLARAEIGRVGVTSLCLIVLQATTK